MAHRSKARRKPLAPEEIAERKAKLRLKEKNPANWGANIVALELPLNGNVETRRDGAGKVTRHVRLDVFDCLLSRGALDANLHQAVRRLEQDMAARAGLGSPERTLDAVDNSCSTDPRKQAFRQYQIDAGIRVDQVLYATGVYSALLLRALTEPGAIDGAFVAWREVVQRVTGEKREDSQSALVRAACSNLSMAYQLFDRGLVRNNRSVLSAGK